MGKDLRPKTRRAPRTAPYYRLHGWKVVKLRVEYGNHIFLAEKGRKTLEAGTKGSLIQKICDREPQLWVVR